MKRPKPNNRKRGGALHWKDNNLTPQCGPRLGPHKPITMKGRTKDFQDANEAASFGLSKSDRDGNKTVRSKGLPSMKDVKNKLKNFLHGAESKMSYAPDCDVKASEQQVEKRLEGRPKEVPVSGRKRTRRTLDGDNDDENVSRRAAKKQRGRRREYSSR